MNAHVIIGEDDFLVEEAAKKAIGSTEGLEVIDSVNATNADLQMADLRRAEESVLTPPFLEPRKATWWKNVHFLPSGGAGGGEARLSQEVKEALEAFAKRLASLDLPDNQVFVLSGPRLLKTSLFAKALLGKVTFAVFSPCKPWEEAAEAARRAEAYAREEGLSFAPQAAARFVAIVGTDARSLKSEVQKLRDYLGAAGATIRAEDMAAVSSPGAKVEAEVWDLTDAIGRRNLAEALKALRVFALEKGFAVFMSGIVEKFFRQLIDVKEGRTGAMSPYAVRKNEAFAANWSLAELRTARDRFFALREAVVSGTTAGEELIVIELTRALRRPSSR